MAAGELEPDFGPRAIDPRAGAVLVAARPPLVAFNVDLATDDVELRASASPPSIRESGAAGLPGVRAIGPDLPSAGPRAGVDERPRPPAVPLAELVEARRASARRWPRPSSSASPRRPRSTASRTTSQLRAFDRRGT